MNKSRFLLIFFLDYLLRLSLCCFENFNTSALENQITGRIKDLISSKEEIPISCLELLIQRGFYKAAFDLYDDYFLIKHSDLKELAPTVIELKKNLENLLNMVISTNTQIQIIEPVFQWAQSRENIFIQIKFAHRFDSPGCISVKDEQVEIERKAISLSAFGIEGNQPIKFELKIKLLKDIDAETSYWKLDSVGRMFLNLTKAEESSGTLWKRLLEKKQKIPIWWEMKTTYRKDMEDFQNLLDEEEDQKEKLEEKERKKKKNKNEEKDRRDEL